MVPIPIPNQFYLEPIQIWNQFQWKNRFHWWIWKWAPQYESGKIGKFSEQIGLKGCKWFGLIAPDTESLESIPILEPILVVEPIPVVDPIPPVPILALHEVNTIPIPIPKKMESQQR